MARSLSKIQEQIARLQKEAESIQSTVIARIKKEIAQFGLTAEHLFGTTSVASTTRSTPTRPATGKRLVGKSKESGKPAKYADGQGNTWGGMGKRPQWVHAALEAGRALEDFLIGAKKTTARAKAASAPQPTAPQARKKVITREKPAKAAIAAASKANAKGKNSRNAAAPAKKAAPKKTAAKKPRAKAPLATTTESSQTGG